MLYVIVHILDLFFHFFLVQYAATPLLPPCYVSKSRLVSSGKPIFPFNKKRKFVLLNINSCVVLPLYSSTGLGPLLYRVPPVGRLSSLPLFVLVLLCVLTPRRYAGQANWWPYISPVVGDWLCLCLGLFINMRLFFDRPIYFFITDISPSDSRYCLFPCVFLLNYIIVWIFVDICFIAAQNHN